jgi:hypothetical protein
MTTTSMVERECPECGSPAEASQEYCLQCGHRLPPDPVAAGVPRRALASGGPAWTLLVTGVIALLAAAAVAAVQLTTDEAEPMFVATSPQPTVIPTTAPPEPTATVPTTTAPQPTTPPPTQPPPRADRVIEWPSATDGWTLVLASIPEGSGNRAVATRQARQALDRGLRQVGVLVSSRYTSLHPGYLVVFSGVFTNRSAAEQALSRARVVGYRSAYTRQITP